MSRTLVRRALVWSGAVALVAVVLLAGALYYVTPRVRTLLVEALSGQTGRPVRIDTLSWGFWPGLSVEGKGIEIGAAEGASGPPLLQADSIRVRASLLRLLEGSRRVESARLKGLHIHIPRRRESAARPSGKPAARSAGGLVIGELILEDTELEIESANPEKPPRRLRIHELRMQSLDLERALPFEARLTYPRPAGELHVEGSFGPWNGENPVETAISGTYDFRRADLGTFRRIRGLLSATGSFEGTIDRTSILGQAEVPDFVLVHSGHVVPLRTEFQAELRDRGAELELREVRTAFLSSVLVARGHINKDGEGRSVDLRVTGDQARIEDLLKFALKSAEPPLVGDVKIETDVRVPSDRERTVIEKIAIRGDFRMTGGRFTSVNLQKTLGRLSRLGGGESAGEQGETALSHMVGEFTLEDAVVDFSRLVFGVPDFDLDLSGRYVIADESMDLAGDVLMTRSPSEMLPESWSRWTRIIDPYLRGERAGTQLPIRITGTRTRPSIRISRR